MTQPKRLVLDANILLRATFGLRARKLIEQYCDTVLLCTPEYCLVEARKYIPVISTRRNLDLDAALLIFEDIVDRLEVIDERLYIAHQVSAHKRIDTRDPEDWPILAAALFLECPIWTEDRDFFGCGVSTWTSRTVELYLHKASDHDL
jgi:predicted nucleic acid-binding protein